MTRWFGHDTDGIVQDAAGNLVGSASYTAWTAETGGSQITNLVDAASASLPSGIIPVTAGRMLFGDPTDTHLTVWLEQVGGDGSRQAYVSRSIADLVESGGSGTVTAVNGITPGIGGNVILTATDLGAITQSAADARYLQPIQTFPRAVQPIALTSAYWAGTSGHPFVSVGAAGTVTDDTTNFVLGDRSIKLTTDGAGGQCAVGKYVLSTPIDMTDQVPVIWIYMNGMARLIDWKFWLGDSSFANYYQWNLLENAAAYPYQMDQTWVPISLPLGTAVTSGTPDRAALTSIQLVAYDNNTGNPVSVNWGGLGFTQDPKTSNPQGVVSFCLDDGHGTAYSKAAPYLGRYGYRATCYLIAGILQNPGTFTTYMTLAQCRQLQDQRGWAMASHAYSTALHSSGYDVAASADVLNDMWAVRGYLSEQGFKQADHFALPLGAYNASVLENGLHVFRSMRTLVHPTFETVPPAAPMRLRAVSPTASTTLSQMEAWVDQAVAGGEWLVFTFHALVDSGAAGTDVLYADFQALVDYVNSSGAAVRTVPEVIESSARGNETAAALAGYVKLSGGNTYTAPNSLSQHASYAWPDDASDPATWPNRQEWKYAGLLGTHIDKRSLLRANGTAAGEVVAQFKAHASQTAAILQATESSSANVLFEVLMTLVRSYVGLKAPFQLNEDDEALYFGSADPNVLDRPPVDGDGWLDLSTSPPVFRKWVSGAWSPAP